MSYQVLARKWRPKSFAEMVGQQHVLKALVNALDQNRLHHAYLFTGTRGVGKTTIARIFAKSLNCEVGVSSQACGQCSSCQEIDSGSAIDLIEVDAASRTRVEDTRELMDNVQYAPTKARYKVYLIDEVHMLSNHSFNALLKTLEEPPPHVKFLLATTDPQKLPVTVLSRCLQFNLKAMSSQAIEEYLAEILEKEMVPFEQGALKLLARAADGSMRDALSLTDQAIAHGNENVDLESVRAMLGSIDQSYVINLLEALSNKDVNALLAEVEKLSLDSPDYKAVVSELINALHEIAIGQYLGEGKDNSDSAYLALCEKFKAEDIQLYYQSALIGRRDINLAPDPRLGFEMLLLRMISFAPQSILSVGSPSTPSVGRTSAKSNSEQSNPSANPVDQVRSDLQKKKHELSVRPVSSKQPDSSISESRLHDMQEQEVQAVRPEQKLNSDTSALNPEAIPEAITGANPEQIPEVSSSAGGLSKNGSVNLESSRDGSGQEKLAASLGAPSSAKDFEYKNIKDRWTQVVLALNLDGAPLSLAKNSNFKKTGEGKAQIILDPKFEMLATVQTQKKLNQSLNDFFSDTIELEVVFEQPKQATPEQLCQAMDASRMEYAKAQVLKDPNVGLINSTFDALILDESAELL